MVELLQSAEGLMTVPGAAVDEFVERRDELIAAVNHSVAAHHDFHRLTGGNPVSLMEANHRHHALFMTGIFRCAAYEVLARTVPWVYRVYGARGYDFDYFPVELHAWQSAIDRQLTPAGAAALLPVYDWMTARHATWVELATTCQGPGFSLPRQENDLEQVLTALLLAGDHRGALALAERSVGGTAELAPFYQAAGNALATIGTMWEKNLVSVAEEHLATAIVGRIMAALYPRVARIDGRKGEIILACVPNELHDIGIRMLADLLELDGWQPVCYGANLPLADLVARLTERPPFAIALSVGVSFNIDSACQVIAALRRTPPPQIPRIAIGGQGLSHDLTLWRRLGADGYAEGGAGLIALVNRWWEERQP